MTTSQIVNRTRKASRNDYDAALTRYLDSIPLNNLRAIYRVGSIGAPGLSDIDIILIFKDDRRDFAARYSIDRLNEFDRYLFSHEAILVDESTFRNLPYWFPFFQLHHIFGEELPVANRTGDFSQFSMILLINYLLTKIPYELMLYSFLRWRLHERILLAMLNSLRHSLALWELMGNCPSPHARDFAVSFSSFREAWFSLSSADRTRQLIEYVVKAINLSLELIASVSIAIQDRWYSEYDSAGVSEWVLKTRSRRLIFSGSWTDQQMLRSILSSGRSDCSFPKQLGILLAAFLSSQGLVGNHVRKTFLPQEAIPRLSPAVSSFFKQYCDVIERYASFHARKFHAPAIGYHTFWAPHTESSLVMAADLLLNRLTSILLRGISF